MDKQTKSIALIVGGIVSALGAGFLWGSATMHKKMAKKKANGTVPNDK